MREDAAVSGHPSSGLVYDCALPLGKGSQSPAQGLDALQRAGLVEGSCDEPSRLLPALLSDLGVSAEDYMAALVAGRRNGTDAAAELIAQGRLGETALATAFGVALRLPAEPILPDDRALTEAPPHAAGPGARFLRTCDSRLRSKLFMVPRLEDLEATARLLAADPGRRSLVRITTAGEIARHLEQATVSSRSEAACLSLSKDRPAFSARQVLTGPQGFAFALLLCAAALFLSLSSTGFFAALHLVGLPLFSGCVALRFLAISAHRRQRKDDRLSERRTISRSGPHQTHPRYTVLAALYREHEVAADLVDALARLRWPRSRLDVKLICEGDDAPTIAAVRQAIADKPGFSIVIVPPSLPRTKPKALNFALPLASGEFLVLYDAEDRPDPGQLEAAWRAFREGEERLACLQAPLVIGNGRGNWLAGHFALEYAALFRGLLPWLAGRRLPMPLGGTSNHFRKSALLAVGGWDSHNVTEDADLGMRLCRSGYRIGTIDTPTHEDAPERWRDWRNQRTRWMKGWLQTWLLHMRDPVRLARDLGMGGFLAFQLLFFGMIASAAIHPLFAMFLGYSLWAFEGMEQLGLAMRIMIAADLLTLVLGYIAFAWLAVGALDSDERYGLGRRLASLHVYWLLISLAALRAVGQLLVNPHGWEKTPHGPASRAGLAAVRREPIFDAD